jgi:hypothetical protein
MRVFISWSGPRSRALAEYIKEWLPLVIQAVEPWVSTAIEKGTRGVDEISQALESTGLGVICLTRDNLESTWVHYEAGALARSHERVWTFLLDISHADVRPPLSQFQHTLAEREEVWQLITSINTQAGRAGERMIPEDSLRRIFDRFWPDLEVKIEEIRAMPSARAGPIRSERDLLEEVLESVRYLRQGTVTIHRNVRIDFDTPVKFSRDQMYERVSQRLGGSYPNERLGTVHLEGSREEAARIADKLTASGLVEAVHVESNTIGYPTLTFASSTDSTPKAVVEAIDGMGCSIVISRPATDRLKAEMEALSSERPAEEGGGLDFPRSDGHGGSPMPITEFT